MPNNMEKVRRMVQEQFPEKSDEEVEKIVRELYELAEIIYAKWDADRRTK